MCTGGRTVLVVDDNEDCRETLALLLKAHGYEVLTAPNGRHGLEAAQRHRPETVITDIGMPEMDGYELAAAIRANDQLAPTCIVALSGWRADQCTHKAEGERVFDKHLVKPADLDAILQAVGDPE